MKINVEEENLTSEEALAKVSMILANTENPRLLSHVSHDEVALLAPLHTIADMSKITYLQNFITNFLELRVSLERMGRREMLEIAGGTRHEPEKIKGLRKLFAGMGR